MRESNRREFTRVDARVRAEMVAGDRKVTADRTRDVSMKGLFVPCDTPLEIGTECDVVVEVGESPKEAIRARARVARVTDEGMGLEFINLVGLHSHNNLRSLVLLNASNAEQIAGEISRGKGPRPSKD